MDISTETVARELLDVVPVIMRTIRTEMRRHRANDVTVPLFRSLMFIEGHPGVSLLSLAGHLGLTSPSACKIVDGLVAHSMVERQHSDTDRRKITLEFTAKERRCWMKPASTPRPGYLTCWPPFLRSKARPSLRHCKSSNRSSCRRLIKSWMEG